MSARGPCSITCSEPRLVESSSAMTPVKIKSPASGKPDRFSAIMAASCPAMPPFMSTVPRPVSLPFTTWGANGAGISPGGTVSIWPLNISAGPLPFPFSVPTTLQRPSRTSCSVAGMPSRANSAWMCLAQGVSCPGDSRWDCTRTRSAQISTTSILSSSPSNFCSSAGSVAAMSRYPHVLCDDFNALSVGGRGSRAARRRPD